jgi:hypothetical protein
MNKTLALPLIIFSTFVFADATPESQLKEDCFNLKKLSVNADNLYKSKNFVQARMLYEKQAALYSSCPGYLDKVSIAYNNVALTYAHTHDYLKALAWLNIKQDDKKSIFNLNKYKNEIMTAVIHADKTITGTYWSYAGYGMWSSIKVTKAKNNQFNIDFNGLHPNSLALYGGVNMGEFYVTLPITNNKAKYVMNPKDEGHCTFDFIFNSALIIVNRIAGSSSDCGFGMNVTAEGTYLKVQE